MESKLKFWLFDHYWRLTLAFFCIGIVIIGMIFLSPGMDFKLPATLLGMFLALLYFLHRQRLEEMKLFREIFAECNGRYDKMNENLNKLFETPDDQELTPCQRAILNDYFNLCGEEYLYYRQGYILPEAWKAWHKGMQHFLQHKKIANFWAEEKESESYYGLPL